MNNQVEVFLFYYGELNLKHKNNNYDYMAIISAVGTRQYYKKMG